MNFLQKENQSGKHPINKLSGQVALETTIAIVAIFIFLLGATQVFLWVNRNIIARQKAYQESRLQLGEQAKIDFYQPTEFHIFPQEAQGGAN